jgi:hypothetical protein
MTGNEPELLQRYRGKHPDFPHECTADQFFNEHQFEAYRQLGVHMTEGLFSRPIMDGEAPPTSIPAWFRHLVGNLMEPNQL